jgi:hypothetical protein
MTQTQNGVPAPQERTDDYDFLTDQDLVARGWSMSELQQAIRSGQLKAVRNGTGFAVLRTEFSDWMRRTEKANAATAGRQTGATPTAPRQAASPAAGGATVEWNAAIAWHIARGVSRPAAIRHVDRERPGLRERMLAECNETARRQRDLDQARAAAGRTARQRS